MRAFVLVVCLAASCGTDKSIPFERTRAIATLSDDEKGALCDWVVEQYGGYGANVMCKGGETRRSDASREACVASLKNPGCAASVGDAETCTLKRLSCETDKALGEEPSCQRLLACAP